MANPIVQQISAELETLQKELGQFKATVEYLNGAKTHVSEAVQTVNQAETNFKLKIEELKNTYNSIIRLSDSVTQIIAKIDTINFPERLDNIEKSVKETIANLNETKNVTIGELQKASEIIIEADFDGRFTKLQGAIEISVSKNEALANTIEKQNLPGKIDDFGKSINDKLEASIVDLKNRTNQIAAETAKSIHDLNLPIRIDKLDATISGILVAIQNVQGRIESVERNIGDKLNEANEKQTATLSNLQEKVIQNLSDTKNELNISAKRQQKNAYITWTLIIVGVIAISLLIKL